jgi:hypothetical protein
MADGDGWDAAASKAGLCKVDHRLAFCPSLPVESLSRLRGKQCSAHRRLEVRQRWREPDGSNLARHVLAISCIPIPPLGPPWSSDSRSYSRLSTRARWKLPRAPAHKIDLIREGDYQRDETGASL